MIKIEELIKYVLKLDPLTGAAFEIRKRKFAKQYESCPSNIKILNSYRKLVKDNEIKPNSNFEQILKKQKTRTISGIASVWLVRKPKLCPK
jgi:histone acetyltransferase (RNA polymerase elongator complex component)